MKISFLNDIRMIISVVHSEFPTNSIIEQHSIIICSRLTSQPLRNTACTNDFHLLSGIPFCDLMSKVRH